MNNSSLTLSHDFLYHPDSAYVCATYSVSFNKKAKEKRLNKMGLNLHLQNRPRGHFPDGMVIRHKSGKELTDELCCLTGTLKRVVEGPSGTIFQSESPQLYYVNVTSNTNSTDIGNMEYCCPNCGCLSRVSDLLNGCAYCHTRFEISELYPKITEFFFLTDHGITENELKSNTKKLLAIGAVTGAVFGALTLFALPAAGVSDYLSRFIISAFLGMIFSYIAGSVKKAGAVFNDAAETVPLISKQNKSQRFFNEFSNHFQESSYEHFAGTVYSLLESVIFSEDCTSLPFYTGKHLDLFNDVIDCTFRGALEITGYRFDDSLCNVRLTVFLTTYRYSAGRVISQQERIHLSMKKVFSDQESNPFTIHAVNCDFCGASFDSMRVRTCPYCGNSYKKADTGWIITSITK